MSDMRHIYGMPKSAAAKREDFRSALHDFFQMQKQAASQPAEPKEDRYAHVRNLIKRAADPEAEKKKCPECGKDAKNCKCASKKCAENKCATKKCGSQNISKMAMPKGLASE